MLEVNELQTQVERMHEVKAILNHVVAVKERFDSKRVWEGAVTKAEVLELLKRLPKESTLYIRSDLLSHINRQVECA